MRRFRQTGEPRPTLAERWTSLRAVGREQCRIEVTPIAGSDWGEMPADTRRWARVLAWAAISSLFVLGWGQGTVAAIRTLLSGEPAASRTVTSPADLLFDIGVGVAVTAIALFLCWYFGIRSVPRPRWRTSVVVFFVYQTVFLYAMSLVSEWADWLGLESFDYPHPQVDPQWLILPLAFDSALAGPAEELTLLALVVLALRTTGYRWLVVCLVAVLVRVPFHMYYGWTALALALWAVLGVALYRRTGAIGAMIAAHAVGNLLATLGSEWSVFIYVRVVLMVVGAAVTIRYCWMVFVVEPGKRAAELAARSITAE